VLGCVQKSIPPQAVCVKRVQRILWRHGTFCAMPPSPG
jgi:hypothetical protein